MYTVNVGLMGKMGIEPGALTGKTALVTGAARGIGEATAMTLARLGAQVIIVDKLPQGQAVADSIQTMGGQARFIQCDLSVVDQLMGMIPQAVSAFGKVDLLINNALYLNAAPTIDLSLEDWEKTFATNARAPFLTIKHFLPGMLARKDGVIVNVIAYEGSPMATAYSGTKMALRSMALSVAREIGDQAGVSVFSFVPGIVDTPLIQDVIAPQTAAVYGIPVEQVVQILAQNPGYPGLVPVDHCATALVYEIVHASEYHGQVADPFEPLDRFGVIEIPQVDPSLDPANINVSDPLSALYVRQYLSKVTSINKELELRVEERTRELEAERLRSETLLLNILPPPIAARLKRGEKMIADYFTDVTVLFADLVNFTPLSASLAPQRTVEVLNTVFSEFDKIAGHFELEKIKTVGDCYMAVGGLPEPRTDHAERVANAALQMVPALSKVSQELDIQLSARFGLDSGAVVAGVIGQQKFIYDLWGDPVNTASRMESHGIGNRIQCTESVYHHLNNRYSFEPRGLVPIKGKGLMQTYFLLGSI